MNHSSRTISNVTTIILAIALLVPVASYGQNNAADISQTGWYRIAVNGPMEQGKKGGTRAAARFTLRNIVSGRHQATTFLAYVHHGQRPALAVLDNSYYNSTPPFTKLRIVERGTYEGAAVEVFVIKPPNIENHVYYTLQDNIQNAGWTAVDWQFIAASSSDDAGIPAGFSAHVISLINLVQGYVTDQGTQQSFFNGNLYASGNVGIGTTDPQSTLAVNGTVTAKKIKVTAASWPDYVFDSTYVLKPLDDLDHFLQTYRHLPNVPSAREIATNGNDLGKTQIILLKKIEELTRYTILLHKRLQQQASEIKRMESLDAEITQLKNRLNHLEKQTRMTHLIRSADTKPTAAIINGVPITTARLQH